MKRNKGFIDDEEVCLYCGQPLNQNNPLDIESGYCSDKCYEADADNDLGDEDE